MEPLRFHLAKQQDERLSQARRLARWLLYDGQPVHQLHGGLGGGGCRSAGSSAHAPRAERDHSIRRPLQRERGLRGHASLRRGRPRTPCRSTRLFWRGGRFVLDRPFRRLPNLAVPCGLDCSRQYHLRALRPARSDPQRDRLYPALHDNPKLHRPAGNPEGAGRHRRPAHVSFPVSQLRQLPDPRHQPHGGCGKWRSRCPLV